MCNFHETLYANIDMGDVAILHHQSNNIIFPGGNNHFSLDKVMKYAPLGIPSLMN